MVFLPENKCLWVWAAGASRWSQRAAFLPPRWLEWPPGPASCPPPARLKRPVPPGWLPHVPAKVRVSAQRHGTLGVACHRDGTSAGGRVSAVPLSQRPARGSPFSLMPGAHSSCVKAASSPTLSSRRRAWPLGGVRLLPGPASLQGVLSSCLLLDPSGGRTRAHCRG